MRKKRQRTIFLQLRLACFFWVGVCGVRRAYVPRAFRKSTLFWGASRSCCVLVSSFDDKDSFPFLHWPLAGGGVLLTKCLNGPARFLLCPILPFSFVSPFSNLCVYTLFDAAAR